MVGHGEHTQHFNSTFRGGRTTLVACIWRRSFAIAFDGIAIISIRKNGLIALGCGGMAYVVGSQRGERFVAC